MAEVASAFVTIAPSAKGFGRGLDSQISPELDKSGKTGGKRFGSAFGGAAKSVLAPAIGLLGVAAVGGLLKDSIGEARESQKVAAQTNAVLKSTGATAGVTAKKVGALSTAISNKTGIDDEQIAAGENMLLTFTNVRDGVGKNNKIFTEATKISTDLAVATGTDQVSANVLLGKALNDPAKGLGRLTKIGVTFTQQQKDQVAAMVKAGDTAGAQKIILAELAKEFGGSAEAQATAGDKMNVAIGNLKETIGTALLPVIDKFEKKITDDVVPAASKFIGEMQNGTGAGGRFVQTLKDIVNAGKPIVTTVGRVIGAFAGLPGSTQKLLALAAAVLLLKNRFGDSIPSLSNFDGATALATAKTVAMRGGALAAGAALATLSSKAGGASTTLGALSTIGAQVATGYAVGGPWGAALGAGSGVLTVFSSQSQSAAASQRQLEAGAASVAATLDRQTGSLTANTRAQAAKTLADSGAFAAAKIVGASYKDVLDASLGNEAATKRVTTAVNAYTDAQGDGYGASLSAATVAGQLTKAIGVTSAEIANEKTKIDQTNTALGNLDGKKATVTVEQKGLFSIFSTLVNLGETIDTLNKKPPVKVKGSASAYAKGTNSAAGGLALVGEKGPELINLAKGAQVIPNNKIGDVSPAHSAAASQIGGPMAISPADILAGATVKLVVGQREFALAVQDANRTGGRQA